MFIKKQPIEDIQNYFKYLKGIVKYTRLASVSNICSLNYRSQEIAFYTAFGADNLSRKDIAVDVKKGEIGIALKTFISYKNDIKIKEYKNEKIAEFNYEESSYLNLSGIDRVKSISELFNLRIDSAKNTYNLKNCIYHYIVREEGKLKICEGQMDYIDIPSINNINDKGKSISFTDNKNRYNFVNSKSTLYKYFDLTSPLYIINVGGFISIDKIFGEFKNSEIISDSEIKVLEY